MKLIIGNRNYSSWSLRAWLLLAWHRLEFDVVRIPLFAPGYRDKLLAYSPTGQVPVLVDDSLVVWDSLAICEYVSERYLDGAGWPADREARAEARSVSAEMHAGFAAIRQQLPMNVRASGRQVAMNAALQAEIARIDSLWNDLRTRHRDRGPWLFGDFSIADCLYVPMALRFATYGIQLSAPAGDYLRTVAQQPLVQAWIAAAREEQETIDIAEVGIPPA